MPVSFLEADVDTLSDAREEGSATWDDVRTAVLEPATEETVVTLEVGLLWRTAVRSGPDPFMEYRVVRRVQGAADHVVFEPAVLDASRGDPPSNRFPFTCYDVPGTTSPVSYVLQARGRGVQTSQGDTCYGTRSVWVPPVTRREERTRTTYQTGSDCFPTRGGGPHSLTLPPAGCTGDYGGPYFPGDGTICTDHTFTCTETYYEDVEVEAGRYATESYSFPCTSTGYHSSAGLVALEKGTSIHATQPGDYLLPW